MDQKNGPKQSRAAGARLRRENDALRQEVVALRAKLAALAPRDDGVPIYKRGQDIQRLFVRSENDLYLGPSTRSDLALQILDALPLQIFIKRMPVEQYQRDGAQLLGRRYTYLNYNALQLTKWSSADVAERYDRDAIPNDEEWNRIFELETQTMKNNRRETKELRWTLNDGTWRINDIIQLPINVRDENGESKVIGMCALAHDIEFAKTRETARPMMRIFAHEFRNLCTKIISLINTAQRRPESRDLALEQAKAWARSSHKLAESILSSYMPIHGAPRVDEIAQELRTIFDGLPVHLTISPTEEIASRTMRGAHAVQGIAVELVRNAIKHTDEDLYVGLAPEVRVSVDTARSRSGVQCAHWIVSNRAHSIKGRLELARPDEVRSRLGGQIVGELFSHAIALDLKDGSDFDNFFVFPKRPDADGWVNVELFIPLADEPGTSK